MKKLALVLTAFGWAAFAAAETVYSAGGDGWGTALTVAAGDVVVVAGGDAAASVWDGAVTIQPGGTLKTTGRVRFAGTVDVNAKNARQVAGHLDIVSGVCEPTFGSRTMAGDLSVRAGAEVRMNCTDAFYYNGNDMRIEVWGVFNGQGWRQSFSQKMLLVAHDGAQFLGNNTDGGIDYFDPNRIVLDGTVVFEMPVKSRDAGEVLTMACCEGTTAKFLGGFGTGSGTVSWEAASADDGNTAGTCENLTLELVDGGNSASPLSVRGTVSFAPRTVRKHALTVAEGTALTLVSSEARLVAAHAFVQEVPSVTGTVAGGIALTGDGLFAFPAALEQPLAFAGASVLLTTGTPLELAAESSVTAPTRLLVEDLPAGQTTTLLTGAGAAALDAASFTVRPAHLGVALGTSSAAALVDGSLVANDVAAYDATAWVEPYLVRRALLWLDAQDGGAFGFREGLEVETWYDKSLYGRDATAYVCANHEAAWGTYGIAAGVPAYRMGACDSGVDLGYTRMTTIRTVFFAMAIEDSMKAFFLADSSEYNFHRGTAGQYSYTVGTNPNNAWYCDGAKVADTKNTHPPTDRHVYTCVTAANLNSNRLTLDRGCTDRNAGRDLSELICLDHVLADADRETIEAALAAKWMGAAPTAGATEVRATLAGPRTVTGAASVGLDVEFAEGLALTIEAPSATEPMFQTTGALTVTATQVPVTINAARLAAGTYTVVQGGAGTNLSLDRFVGQLTPPAGGTARLALADGKLVLVVTEDGGVVTELLWRPTTDEERAWSTEVAAWLNNGARSVFETGANVLFDGGGAGDVAADEDLLLGAWRVIGAEDYTFKGTGTLDGTAATVFAGTGTVTLDGPNLGSQDVEIQSGTVVLGASAGAEALGAATSAGGGVVKVAAGAQFNLNYIGAGVNNSDARAAITHQKTFQLAGDGPDGRGAFVNDALDGRTTHTAGWNSSLRRVELTDDATIGGLDRFDVRLHTASPATMEAGIFGADKTLTVKNSGWFGLVGLPLQVGAVNITDGGVFRPEGLTEAQIDVPGGITLDNGTLHAYNSTYPASVPLRATANGAAVDAQNGKTTFAGPLTIDAGATLQTRGGSYEVWYNGAITNQGTFKVEGGVAVLTGETAPGGAYQTTGGTTWLRNPILDTDFTLAVNGGTVYMDQGFTAEHVTVNWTGGSFYLNRTPTFDTLDYTGQFFGFRTESLAGPTFKTVNIDSTGSSLDILPQAAGIADVTGEVNVNKTGGTMYVYGPNATAEHGMKMLLKGSAPLALIGLDSNRSGTLELKAESDFAIPEIRMGAGGSGPARGALIIDADAKLTVATKLWVGEWSGTPSVVSKHTLDVGGTLEMPNVVLQNAWDSPRSEIILRDGGTIKTKGFATRNASAYGNGVGAGEGYHKFLMQGGRLELGASGVLSDNNVPGVLMYDFAQGDIVNTAAWGTSSGTLAAFGETARGGQVTFDLGESLVNWNTGLSGASDVTLKGAANFQGKRLDDHLQGALIGKLTIENTGANDLRAASVFGGGLELAPGVRAEVANWGDEKYAYNVNSCSNKGSTDLTAAINDANATVWSYAYTSANLFDFLHRWNSANPYQSYTAFSGRGEFYVPAAKAGVWTFGGCYDDWVCLYVDGAAVMRSTAVCSFASGKVTLTEGWHTFSFAVGDNSGACGPSGTNWKALGMSLGFIVGDVTAGDDAANYTKFAPGASLGDDLALQIRPCANACIWSYQNGNGSWDTTENWTHIKPLRTLAYMHLAGGNASADPTGCFATKANRFQGWFKVEDDQVGEWNFKMGYDDNKLLNIDGERVVNTTTWNVIATGKKELDAGWHRWEVRVQDGSGGWGPNGLNNGNTLSFTAPGGTEKQWNETNLKLAATLGDIAVLEPTGISRDLVLGADATLASTGSEPMKIYGTLKGSGTLSGAFAFAGTHNAWEVEGEGSRRVLTQAATFADVTAATFAGLAEVKATFTGKPTCSFYALAAAPEGLTSADLADVKATVVDDKGVDYSAKFQVGVLAGQLGLVNTAPGGLTIFLR